MRTLTPPSLTRSSLTRSSFRHLRSKQQGLSFIGWLFALFIGAVIVQAAIKLSPSYMEAYNIKTVLKGLADNPELPTLSTPDVRERLEKRFSINDIGSEARSGTKVRSADNNVLVDIQYEKRVPFMANIDVVLTFSYHLDSSKPDMCC